MAAGLEVHENMREVVGAALVSSRTHANDYYADNARQVVEVYAKQVRDAPDPLDPVRTARRRIGLDWILARKTVLTELGRWMGDDPSEDEVERFQDAVTAIADRHDKLSAKAAAARIRRQRLGETKQRTERVADLHHDLNVAINLHRQRHPESTWEDVRRALGLTAGQMAGKR
jgi:hypothetical protein